MNYCDRIHYNIWNVPEADFEAMVRSLLLKLPTEELVLRVVFFGKHTSNEEYVAQRDHLAAQLKRFCGERVPVFSLVSQNTLGTGMAMEVHSYVPGKRDEFAFRSLNGRPYVIVENDEAKMLFAGGFQGDVLASSISEQSVEATRQLSELLEKEQFPIHSIIRQWNYIERITSFDGEDQHYQAFNNARSDFYKQTTWENGYPAATGIGSGFGGILIDADAMLFKQEDCFATPIDNKLQVAAHAYSEQVLEASHQVKSTPKFERAKSVTFAGHSLFYISGTAAIRGEESLEGVGLEKQLHTTMENIAELIGDAHLDMLRVYLKEESFFREAKKLLDAYELHIPITYLHADVCRDALLIEIEGIARN